MTPTQAALLILALLQPLDWWTTYTVINQGGRELNPVMIWIRRCLGSYGFNGSWSWLTLTKGGVMIACLLGVAYLGPVSDIVSYALWVVAAAQAYVCWHNWRQIK